VLLSDRDLTVEIKAGNLQLEPFEPELLQPSSIDVRLDRLFGVFNNHLYTHIDPARQQDDLTMVVEVTDGDPFVLHPGEFALGSTLEVITLGDQLAGRLEGKSSLGRLGLLTHSTAGFIDPGFTGSITLEVANLNSVPITLRPGMRIAQIAFEPMVGYVNKSYGVTGHYQGQPAGEPVESRYRL
jgi:dCTP deaminase